MTPKFNFHRGKDHLLVFRNHVLELFIRTKTPMELEKRLRNLLPNDYIEFLEFYDLPENTHTSTYFLNLCDKEREIFDLFSVAISKSVDKSLETV